MHKLSHEKAEHGEFFSVDDALEFDYEELDPETARHFSLDADSSYDPLRMLNGLVSLEQESHVVLKDLQAQLPQIQAYVHILEQRWHLAHQLLRHLTQEERPNLPPQRISLSEAGLGFFQKNAIAPKTYLRLNLVLPPYRLVEALGQVVYSLPVTDNDEDCRMRIGVRFEKLSFNDKRAIVRHVLYCQTRLRSR